MGLLVALEGDVCRPKASAIDRDKPTADAPHTPAEIIDRLLRGKFEAFAGQRFRQFLSRKLMTGP